MKNLKGLPPVSCQRVCVFLFCLLPFFLGACATSGKSSHKLQARKIYDEAEKARSVKQKDDYYAKLKEAIELDPKEPFYHLVLGDAYFMDMKLDEAEKEYLTSIKLGSKYQEGFQQLGRLYMQKGQWDDAIFYLKKAVSVPNLISPHQVYNWLALSYYAKGELNQAEKVWLKALGIKENGPIRLNLGMVYMQAEQFDLARDSLLIAVKENNNLTQAHYELGQLFLKDRNFVEARKHFETVVNLEPLGESAKASKEYLKLIPEK